MGPFMLLRDVTVVDLSASMLDLDRQVARSGLHLELIQSSMDELTMLKNDYFDLVIHPVSSCYLPLSSKFSRNRVLVVGWLVHESA